MQINIKWTNLCFTNIFLSNYFLQTDVKLAKIVHISSEGLNVLQNWKHIIKLNTNCVISTNNNNHLCYYYVFCGLLFFFKFLKKNSIGRKNRILLFNRFNRFSTTTVAIALAGFHLCFVFICTNEKRECVSVFIRMWMCVGM